MAAGNTGEYLDASADTTCTWLSRDGGANWEDVADYAAIYEFGDHGSIILTARYQVTLNPVHLAPIPPPPSSPPPPSPALPALGLWRWFPLTLFVASPSLPPPPPSSLPLCPGF